MARKTRMPKEKILEILAEHDAGAKLSDLIAKHGISASTLYNWKERFGGGGKPRRRGRAAKAGAAPAPRKARAMPARRGDADADASTASETARLKVMLVDLMLERDALKARLARR